MREKNGWIGSAVHAFLRRNSTERRDGQDRNRRTENREDDSTVEHESRGALVFGGIPAEL